MAGWLAAIVTRLAAGDLVPVRMVRVATMASRRTFAFAAARPASLPLFITSMFFFPWLFSCPTMVGIPIAILLPPAYCLLSFAASSPATYVLAAS